MTELEFPVLDADATTANHALTPVAAAAAGLDLLKVNLTDVALAQFGNWRDKTAEARKTLTGVQHDLSTQAKIDDAKSLRQRLINAPLAEARKVSKALKSKLNSVSAEVGAELNAIETDYADVAKLITPQIEAREAELAAEKAAREEAEAARCKVHTDAIAKIAGYVAQATDLPSERIGTGIAYLTGLDLSGFEEFVDEATATRDRSVEALRALQVKAKAREDEAARLEAERIEQARVAAKQAEVARQLKAQQDEIERQKRELAEQQAKLQREQEAREAEDRRQRAAAEDAQRPSLATAQEDQRRQEAAPNSRSATELQELQEPAKTAGAAGLATASPAVIPLPSRAPAAPASQPTLKLGDINDRLKRLKVTEEDLRELGFPAAKRERNACLYHEADFPRICTALINHIAAARDQRQVA